jgi:hypothetical protein
MIMFGIDPHECSIMAVAFDAESRARVGSADPPIGMLTKIAYWVEDR